MKKRKDTEMLRSSYLSGAGLLGGPIGNDELKRARFFIDTMEQYISESEAAEVKSLEAQTEHLSEEAKDDFWQWHYPIHWEDIFGVRIRSAFLVQLCSHIEALLGDVARHVEIIERCGIEPRQLVGSTYEKHRLYVEEFGKFARPSDEEWWEMGSLFRIRNAHIHNQGYAGNDLTDKKFAAFVKALPSVNTDHNFIELKAGSCTALLEIAERFEGSLLEEYHTYVKRVIATENQTEPEA